MRSSRDSERQALWQSAMPSNVGLLVDQALLRWPIEIVIEDVVHCLSSFPPAKRTRLHSFSKLIDATSSDLRPQYACNLAEIQSPCMRGFVLWYLRDKFAPGSMETLLDYAVKAAVRLEVAASSGHVCQWCNTATGYGLMSMSAADAVAFVLRSPHPRTALLALVNSRVVAGIAVAIRTIGVSFGYSLDTCRLEMRDELSSAHLQPVHDCALEVVEHILELQTLTAFVHPCVATELERARRDLGL